MGRDLSGSQSLMSATVQMNFVVKAVAGAPVTEVFQYRTKEYSMSSLFHGYVPLNHACFKENTRKI